MDVRTLEVIAIIVNILVEWPLEREHTGPWSGYKIKVAEQLDFFLNLIIIRFNSVTINGPD